MIIGEYPCCDEPFFMDIPDGVPLPTYCKEECPHCDTVVWHRLSRADPTSWTEEKFLETHLIDEETMQIFHKPQGRAN